MGRWFNAVKKVFYPSSSSKDEDLRNLDRKNLNLNLNLNPNPNPNPELHSTHFVNRSNPKLQALERKVSLKDQLSSSFRYRRWSFRSTSKSYEINSVIDRCSDGGYGCSDSRLASSHRIVDDDEDRYHYYSFNSEEYNAKQNKRAMVAAVAAAEAAVAAAQAAAHVASTLKHRSNLSSAFRQTSAIIPHPSKTGAAIRIQAAFRGYLVRRDLIRAIRSIAASMGRGPSTESRSMGEIKQKQSRSMGEIKQKRSRAMGSIRSWRRIEAEVMAGSKEKKTKNKNKNQENPWHSNGPHQAPLPPPPRYMAPTEAARAKFCRHTHTISPRPKRPTLLL